MNMLWSCLPPDRGHRHSLVLHQDLQQQVPHHGAVGVLYTLYTLLLYTLYRYCSPNCTGRVRLEDPLYNLASPLYSRRWEERVYSLQGAGHCHTFNPENVSLSGLNGQHIVHLGQRLSEQ